MGRKACFVKGEMKRCVWTAEEDERLSNFILNNGSHHSWRILPRLAGLNRTGSSCRLRWANYLRPDIKHGFLTDAEEQLVIDLHALHGNRWSKIAAMLPGRTNNEIKRRWRTNIKKKLIKMGIDPVTHKPLHEHEESSQRETPFVSDHPPKINVCQPDKSPENSRLPEPCSATTVDADFIDQLMSYWVQSKLLDNDFMPSAAGEDFNDEFGSPSSLNDDFGGEEDSGFDSFNDLWTY